MRINQQHKDYLKRNEIFRNARRFSDNNVHFRYFRIFLKGFSSRPPFIKQMTKKKNINKLSNTRNLFRKNVNNQYIFYIFR